MLIRISQDAGGSSLDKASSSNRSSVVVSPRGWKPEDDRLCTVGSDDEGTLYPESDSKVVIHTAVSAKTQGSKTKRAANVLASQPKEGFKFIETKVSSSLQALHPRAQAYTQNYSSNSSYSSQVQAGDFEATVLESFREKFSVN